jgi:hypothetical protein
MGDSTEVENRDPAFGVFLFFGRALGGVMNLERQLKARLLALLLAPLLLFALSYLLDDEWG